MGLQVDIASEDLSGDCTGTGSVIRLLNDKTSLKEGMMKYSRDEDAPMDADLFARKMVYVQAMKEAGRLWTRKRQDNDREKTARMKRKSSHELR